MGRRWLRLGNFFAQLFLKAASLAKDSPHSEDVYGRSLLCYGVPNSHHSLDARRRYYFYTRSADFATTSNRTDGIRNACFSPDDIDRQLADLLGLDSVLELRNLGLSPGGFDSRLSATIDSDIIQSDDRTLKLQAGNALSDSLPTVLQAPVEYVQQTPPGPNYSSIDFENAFPDYHSFDFLETINGGPISSFTSVARSLDQDSTMSGVDQLTLTSSGYSARPNQSNAPPGPIRLPTYSTLQLHALSVGIH